MVAWSATLGESVTSSDKGRKTRHRRHIRQQVVLLCMKFFFHLEFEGVSSSDWLRIPVTVSSIHDLELTKRSNLVLNNFKLLNWMVACRWTVLWCGCYTAISSLSSRQCSDIFFARDWSRTVVYPSIKHMSGRTFINLPVGIRYSAVWVCAFSQDRVSLDTYKSPSVVLMLMGWSVGV